MRFGLTSCLLAAGLALAGCATTPDTKDYTTFRQSKPRSLVVVPVINHSNEAEAADLFLTTLPVPLAERGYYVFPTHMVKRLMEQEGLSDPQLVHSTDTRRLAGLFNADAVLYVEVLDWKAQWVLTSSQIVVKFLYTLKDGRTGNLLWQDERPFVYSNSSSSGNILADIIASAITAAIQNSQSDYTPVAMSANQLALLTPGIGLPHGPYSPMFEQDAKEFPSDGTGRLSNAETSAVAWPVTTSKPDAAKDGKAAKAKPSVK